ncbi:hypothetical protein PIB30_102033 [Stylosanthes scabra]|uniref:Uncharacterized protein n=1 Tax=Stylosanthes scabra TaxID=79078 RepID=A0ABU6ZWA7_9FABA|nr:hypothetical protein [Stylosanthes scabra]
MEIDGVSFGSRRSGSGRRDKRSSPSTQGFFVAKVRNERDGTAPKCNCGIYAVLYLSKTTNNPNRLFFGPFFKFGKTEDFKGGEDEDVNEHFANMKLDIRLGDLEERVSAIEKKKKKMRM